MPSSSARRRNAPNLISPLHRAHGFGVRPAPCSATKSLDHALLELGGHLDDLEREPGRSARPLGVGAGRGSAAPVLDVVEVHEPHVRADDLVALLVQQAGGDRRVDPAGHRDQHRSLRSHGRQATPRERVYRSAMIEARFDDLTGASDSFRLDRPGRRARGAAARRGGGRDRGRGGGGDAGLWVAGFVAYEAAPGLDPSMSRARTGGPATRSPSCRSRGSRCSRVASARCCPSPDDAGPTATTDAWRPSIDRRDLRRGDRPDPRAHRGRRHLPGEPHAPAALARRGRRTRALSRPLLRAARRVRGVPEPRTLPGALGLARAVLPHRRRPHHARADEGHRPPGPLARRGRRGRGGPAGLGEGPGGERDDRRPAPQRPGQGRADRLGDVERRVRPRAVRDGVAAHVDRLRGARARRRRSSTSSGRSSRADR